ncbi:CPBP family intramembrane glutamic endopeptidase [Staphylococcus hyicus]|uniref:CPBP family intramembrane glutamic endopeptidase n=1 Tax=Staphylococcus hyicus TaxID=1284 RepID=UPI00373623D2
MEKHTKFIIAYFIVSGLGMSLMNFGLGIEYGTENFLFSYIAVLVILALMASIYGLRYRASFSMQTPKPEKTFFYFLPFIPFVTLTVLALITASATFSFTPLYLFPLVTSLIIGIAEEGAFRGILLGGLARHMKPIYAVLISALLFALLHLKNVVGGLPLPDATLQAVTTIPIGLFLGVLYVYTRQIIFPILFHMFWDYIFISNVYDAFKYAQQFLNVIEYSLYIVTAILLVHMIKMPPFGRKIEENPEKP